jgi:hypothetical protein
VHQNQNVWNEKKQKENKRTTSTADGSQKAPQIEYLQQQTTRRIYKVRLMFKNKK